MKTSEPLTHGAVEAPDLGGLVHRGGPFLSLYLNTEREVENAARRSNTRWKRARADLEAQDAPEAALARIDPLVPDAHLAGDCLAVIADAEQILHVEHGPQVGTNE